MAAPKGGIDARGVQMSELCQRLGATLDRDTIDKTGLKGAFNFHLELTYEQFPIVPHRTGGADEAASDPGGTIPSALRKVGLRMEPSKAKLDFLVIDSVGHPTEN
jgi:uncharacterized protein (TIGR03435 family)